MTMDLSYRTITQRLLQRYLRIAAVQLRTTVSGAASLDFRGVALTRNRCPSFVTA